MEIKKGKGVQWVDVAKPTDKDLAWLGKEYKLHPIIVDELRGPSARGRVEADKDYLYFIYYFHVYDRDDEASTRTEIDFIITKDSTAIVHYDELDGVLDGFDVAECDSSLAVMYALIEHLINFQERQLRHIR